MTKASREAYKRAPATPAERMRFAIIVVAGLAVALALFSIIRITQANSADSQYDDCLAAEAQQRRAVEQQEGAQAARELPTFCRQG